MRVGHIFASAVVRKVAYVLTGSVLAFAAARCDAAQCVTLEAGGTLTAIAAPVESCAGYVLLTPTELQNMGSVFQPLTTEEGAAVGLAIFSVWTVAFGFRMLRKQAEQS